MVLIVVIFDVIAARYLDLKVNLLEVKQYLLTQARLHLVNLFLGSLGVAVE